MLYKRGKILRDAVAFTLIKLKIHGRKGTLTDQQRHEIGDHVVSELKRYGDPWKLAEDMPEYPLAPSPGDGRLRND
jgi:hypothetical protein